MANPPTHIVPIGPPLGATVALKSQEPWVENLSLNLMCRECKEDPPNIVEDFSAGDTICGSCGLVLGDRIVDTRSEWRTFTNDDQNNDDPSRVGDGANPLLNGAQLQTDIAFVGGASAKSRDLSRTQNKATHDKSTKTLLAAYKEIGSLCDGIGIPKNVSDTAKHLFKITVDENAFRGKSQETVIAGCIFIACRQCKVPRTFREIFDLTKVSKPEIGRVFKALEKFFNGRNEKTNAAIVEAGGIPDPNGSGFNAAVESTTPKDLCLRFCSQLNLSQKCTTLSQDIAIRAETTGDLAGRSPISTAAACIYMASYLAGEARTAKDVSIVAGVSDGTIRNAFKLMLPNKERLVKPEWIADGRADFKRLPVA
ncbi:MAG: hypothetical protein LQ339_007497 [Xanthoria mediterranea]|nr:MAG: hypothetical protein LQ339_007497 [Xanthoria mediterranea]